ARRRARRTRPRRRRPRSGSTWWRARRETSSSLDLRKQALRAQRKDQEKGEVAGEQLPARIDLRADRLRHAEDDAAGQRAPHAAEPADDDRLEAEDQPRRPDRRI